MIALPLFTFCICSEIFKNLLLNSSWTSVQVYAFLICHVRPLFFSSASSLHPSTPIPALQFILSLWCGFSGNFGWFYRLESSSCLFPSLLTLLYRHLRCLACCPTISLLYLQQPSKNFLTEKSSYFWYSTRGTSKEPSFMKLLTALCWNSGLLRMCPICYSKVEVCNIISFEIISYKSRVIFFCVISVSCKTTIV